MRRIIPLQLLALSAPLPQVACAHLGDSPFPMLRRAAAGNAGVCEEQLSAMTCDPDEQVRRIATSRVSDPIVPVAALTGSAVRTRTAAAANPVVPGPLLADQLRGDKVSPAMRRAVLTNPSTPTEAVVADTATPGQLWSLSSSYFQQHLVLAQIAAAHPAVLDRWAGMGNQATRRLCARSALTAEQVQRFAQCRVRDCLAVLAANPLVGNVHDTRAGRRIRAELDAALNGLPAQQAVLDPTLRPRLAASGWPALDVLLAHAELPVDDIVTPMLTREATVDPDVLATLVRRGGPLAALAVCQHQPVSRQAAAETASPLLHAARDLARAAPTQPNVVLPQVAEAIDLLPSLGENDVTWRALVRMVEDFSGTLPDLLLSAAAIGH